MDTVLRCPTSTHATALPIGTRWRARPSSTMKAASTAPSTFDATLQFARLGDLGVVER